MQQPENNFILKMSQEHKLIMVTLKKLQDCLLVSDPAEFVRLLKIAIEPFEMEYVKHIRIEEFVVFRAGLETVPTRAVIKTTLKLQKEHGAMEIMIQNLNKRLWNFSGQNSEFIGIQQNLKDLIKQIKEHSATEIRDLFPVLSTNSNCRKLIELFASEAFENR
jgi:iron-sulfur cluster repair protein YtfE (RIC family)